MNTNRGRRRLLGLIVFLLAILPPGTPAQAGVSRVDQSASSFSPKRVEIALGDKVIWTNRSNASHTVTFEDGTDLHPTCDPDALLSVGCQGPGGTAERTFEAPGSYAYYCKIHRGSGMTGVVLVAAPSSTTVTTAPTSTSTTQRATTTTARPTSSTTTTTRVLATSSTLVPSSTTTTTSETTSVLLPGEPPPLTDETSAAANRSGSDDGSDSGTVALIVALLLAVSAGGALLLWRLRPGRP